MDLPLLPLTSEVVDSTQLPAESLADWREATARLDAYLARWELADPFYQRLIGTSLLALAIREQKSHPGRPPVELTLKLAQEKVTAWLETLPSGIPEAASSGRAAVAVLRLARIGGLDRWPRAFLSRETPPELAGRLRESGFEAGPAVRFSHMVSRPIDYGPFARLAREAWEQVGWKEVGAILAFWTGVFGVACALYFLFFAP
ncbi:hypothetical protein [Methylacidimicrobium tartarophylax]|uniref:Uncharacterized protein n=1 Tax=Methylacidimicrobium tartarophylax TaxID=1041768 RepID=A0A5E6M667_9BACT|nr:hypothetical protein [Methylacidimicrobium tartarophylax]VVM04846.1 hypothetical protein MAMT_00351 [Methylacidimicrobium tartarophylax]